MMNAVNVDTKREVHMKKLKVLVTAGSTVVPIDQVRVISNIFKGRTGTAIALHFAKQDAEVTLLTSNPELAKNPKFMGTDTKVVSYRTFDDLKMQMEKIIGGRNKPDVVIHSAAVSDYKLEGVYIEGAHKKLIRLDASKKVSSRHPVLVLRLVLTDKLVDFIRPNWGFRGILVKFKLEVGITDEELIEIAKRSREASDADLIVANCLEWSGQRAYIIGPERELMERVSRRRLAEELYRRMWEINRKAFQ